MTVRITCNECNHVIDDEITYCDNCIVELKEFNEELEEKLKEAEDKIAELEDQLKKEK